MNQTEKEESTKKTNDVTIELYETEEVVIKLPKPIMDLLRATETVTGDTPVQALEYWTVESIRARIDSGEFLPTRGALVDQYNLNPVFKAILDCSVE